MHFLSWSAKWAASGWDGYTSPYLNDKQISNKVGAKDLPVSICPIRNSRRTPSEFFAWDFLLPNGSIWMSTCFLNCQCRYEATKAQGIFEEIPEPLRGLSTWGLQPFRDDPWFEDVESCCLMLMMNLDYKGMFGPKSIFGQTNNGVSSLKCQLNEASSCWKGAVGEVRFTELQPGF